MFFNDQTVLPGFGGISAVDAITISKNKMTLSIVSFVLFVTLLHNRGIFNLYTNLYLTIA